MFLSDVFDYIKGGKDPNKKTTMPNELMIVKKIQKNAMQNSKFIPSRFIDEKLPFKLDDKYFLQKEDIIISLKEPYKASANSEDLELKVLIPNNYVVLRNIDKKKYNYLFVVNYLNIIGIENLVNNKYFNADLTIDDVKNISLPDISLYKQESLLSLLDSINERAISYELIKDNDMEIAKHVMKDILGDNNV